MSDDAEYLRKLAERARAREATRDLLYGVQLREDVGRWLGANPMTLEEAHQWFDRNSACGCMGGPQVGWPCHCHLTSERAKRALEAAGEPLPPSGWARLPYDIPRPAPPESTQT